MEERKIVKALSNVGKKITAIGMRNMQRYKARHIYDVYNQIQHLIAEEEIVITRALLTDSAEKVQSSRGSTGIHRYQLWEFTFTAVDGSCLSTQFPAESIDYGDKAASQCDAMAFKQMLIHTFMIPTQDISDPDEKGSTTDSLNSNQANNSGASNGNQVQISEKQIKRLYAISSKLGWKDEQLKFVIKKMFNKGSKSEMSKKEYDIICELTEKKSPVDWSAENISKKEEIVNTPPPPEISEEAKTDFLNDVPF